MNPTDRCETAAVAAPRFEIADLIVAYLAQLGVEYVFGVPGGAIEPLYNALARSARRGGPRPMVARHESGAAFMADGYARETGRIGVCCATSGPGATNLITGVACAYDNGVPLLALTGQPAMAHFGRGALQESSCTGIDTVSMLRHCTRYSSLVSHPEQLEHKLAAALMRAAGAPPGPVHLALPLDIQRSAIVTATPRFDLRSKTSPGGLLDEEAFLELDRLLCGARRPVLVLGGRVGEAAPAFLALAERQGMPFVTTPDAKGLVDPRHPGFHGVFGFAGHAAAEALLRDPEVDLVLAASVSMSEWTSNGWCDALLNDRLVHLGAADEHLARSPEARLHVRGNLRRIAERLLKPAAGACGAAPEAIADARRRRLAEGECPPVSDADRPIAPQRLMRELAARFPPSTCYLADAGNSAAWAVHCLASRHRPGERQRRGWLRVTMEFAPMGWAIGAAVGTAAGNPQAPVVCITGDGSLLMNGQELTVAVAERLNVVFVVLNDRALGMVKHGQRLAGAEPVGFELPAIDFAAMARAQGAAAHTLRCLADFDDLDVPALLARPGPTLLDVHIDPEQVPPMGLRMRVLGTAP